VLCAARSLREIANDLAERGFRIFLVGVKRIVAERQRSGPSEQDAKKPAGRVQAG
jgi:hypothetical protein